MTRNKLIIHPLLLAVFPVISLFSHNIKMLSLNDIFAPIVIIFIVVIIIWTILYLIFKSILKAGLITSLCVLLFFSYGHVAQAMGESYLHFLGFNIGKNVLIAPLWTVIIVSCFYITLRTKRPLIALNRIFNISASCLVGILVVLICYKLLTAQNINLRDKMEMPACNIVDPLPDIYLIVLDAYGRADKLNDLYDYDNSRFLHFLDDKGFYTAHKSRSNYCYTHLSLSSMMNLNYVDELANLYGIELLDDRQTGEMIKNSYVSRFLKRLGYTNIVFSSGYSFSEIRDADVFMSPRWRLSEFQNALINTTPIPLFLRYSRPQLKLHRERIVYTFDNIAQSAKEHAPAFVFAHIVCPHPPFVFGANGEMPQSSQLFGGADGIDFVKVGGTVEQYIESYRNQLIFVNKKLLKMIADILSNSFVPPIIVLLSDHGPRMPTGDETTNPATLGDRFCNFHAIYLPDSDYSDFYDELSPVNSFRLIFNKRFGTDYKLLEDKSYFSPQDNQFDFSEIPVN